MSGFFKSIGSALKKALPSIGNVFGNTIPGLAAGFLGHMLGRENATTAYNRQMSLMQYQNDYNTPQNQVARLQEAGLNPALMYGSGIQNVSATPSATPQAQSEPFSLAKYNDFLNAQNLKTQNAVLRAQESVYQNQATSFGADVEVKQAQATLLLAQAAALGGWQADEAQSRIELNQATARLRNIEAEVQEKSASYVIQMAEQKLLNAQEEFKLIQEKIKTMPEERRLIAQKILSAQVERAVMASITAMNNANAKLLGQKTRLTEAEVRRVGHEIKSIMYANDWAEFSQHWKKKGINFDATGFLMLSESLAKSMNNKSLFGIVNYSGVGDKQESIIDNLLKSLGQ